MPESHDDSTATLDELRAAAEAAPDKPTRARAWLAVARACEHREHDDDAAMEAYQRAFKLDQRCLEALAGARRLYQRRGETQMAVKLLSLEIKLAPQAERPALLRLLDELRG